MLSALKKEECIVLKSLITAFSMYSRIPMPSIKWDNGSMKYSFCFFPFIGVVIGFCQAVCFYVFDRLGFGEIIKAVFLALIPIIISGGIHFDGFLDTIDAKSSLRSREERLKILKDPNTGAFAVTYGIIYIAILIGLYSEIGANEILLASGVYVFSRILSGLSVVVLKKAKNEGMAAAEANSANRTVKWVLVMELALFSVFAIFLNTIVGAAIVVAGIAMFFWYRNMTYKIFGGITGDTSGYLLTLCELVCIGIIVVII